MIILLFLLMGLYASETLGQDFVCGFRATEESESGAVGASGHNIAEYRSGTIRPLILFGKFDGAADRTLTALWDREGVANQNAGRLLDVSHGGSLAHYFDEMSHGALTLAPPSGGVATRWYEGNDDSVSVYVGSPCTNWSGGVRRFVREVINDADASIDFSAYDRIGAIDPEGSPIGDGMVDLVVVIVPEAFGRACGPNGTVFYERDFLPRLRVDGVGIEAIITSDYRPSLPFIVGVLAHEHGHVMGLPECFDRDHLRASRRTSYPEHSAGIGLWGVMAGGEGWPHVEDRSSGPNPMSAWSRIEVGWITPVTVTADMLDVRIHDINSSNERVFRLPVSSSEYFLVANRQNGYPTVGSYYDALAPASGLAIWHVDGNVPGALDVNNNELHKRVDLECADGLFSDRGYPGTMRKERLCCCSVSAESSAGSPTPLSNIRPDA